MRIISTLNKLRIEEKTAVSIGKFDGLHRGHQSLIDDIKEFKSKGYQTVILTFSGISNSYITTSEEKYSLAEKSGVDYFIELPFSEIRDFSAERFVEEILIDRLNLQYLSVGEDFQFGSHRSGNVDFLRHCTDNGKFLLSVHQKIRFEDHDISSTLIKQMIKCNDMERANAMLGYPYFIRGKVIHGTRIGSTKLGYPTVNIRPDSGKVLPENGVYISSVVMDKVRYPSISNIGCKPTVSDEKILGIESYILDENFDCYHKTVDIELLSFVRKEKKFASLSELREEITKNIGFARKYFEKTKLEPDTSHYIY